MPETPLLPNDFDPKQIKFEKYDPKFGDQMWKLSRLCCTPAHSGPFDSKTAAAQIFRAERLLTRKRKKRYILPEGARLGTRLAFYTSASQSVLVATYGIVLDAQNVSLKVPPTAYLDNLLVPTCLENPGTLVELMLKDAETQAMAWSVAVRSAVTLGFYVSKGAFGRQVLEKHNFKTAATGVRTRAYGTNTTLYTRRYETKR